MSKIKTFSVGGIHPDKYKITSDLPIRDAGIPDMLYVPVKQHIGAPAKILVKKGDRVKVGTLLADADGIVSADVHAPASGEVVKIEEIVGEVGYLEQMITIKTDGDEWEESIDRSLDIAKLPPLRNKSSRPSAPPALSAWAAPAIRRRLRQPYPPAKKSIASF